MSVSEIKAKSILHQNKKIDSWFLSLYGMNLYRGCMHNCVYCDGRAENYYLDGEFGKDVSVKINAIEVLKRELALLKKKAPRKKGFITIGGGVGDSYQPIEETYQLTRKVLQLIEEYDFPVHILTKSPLIKRDIDILKRINQKNRVIVSMSFSSIYDEISAIFEPNASFPSERLKTLKFFKDEGISCGMFLLPVIPFITDKTDLLESAIRKASEMDLNFLIFGGMTLKEGKQKGYFLKTLKENYPALILEYENLYQENIWGDKANDYYHSINTLFDSMVKKFKIAPRILPELYQDLLEENDLAVVILEHIDYLLKMKGKKSPYAQAAFSISKLKKPLSTMRKKLRHIKGVGVVTEKIILEILDTGSSVYFNSLINDYL